MKRCAPVILLVGDIWAFVRGSQLSVRCEWECSLGFALCKLAAHRIPRGMRLEVKTERGDRVERSPQFEHSQPLLDHLQRLSEPIVTSRTAELQWRKSKGRPSNAAEGAY